MILRWYDDWKLTVARASGVGYIVSVELPNHPTLQHLQVSGSSNEIKALANLLDKLLSELTNTTVKEVIVDGRDSAASA